MPLPTPDKDESREEFMIRFMEMDSMIEKYPDITQRAAVCNFQFNANNGEDRHHMLSFKLSANVATRIEKMDGETYVVAPVVLLVEGVHNGSGGPMYYAPEVLAEFPDAWNGRPVPVLHPCDEDGEPISCNSPEIIEQSVGQLFNVIYDDGKLRGEAWVNQRKARAVQSDLIDKIQRGMMEISVGFFSTDFMMPGIWEGEEYIGAVRNIRPDHLALLPDGRGACSLDDGCGIRANAKSLPVDAQILQKNEKGGTMDKKKRDEKKANDKCCEEEIQMLIENESTSYTEDDRPMLQGASEELIAKMVESLPTKNNGNPGSAKIVSKENQANTFEEVVANSTPKVRDMLTEMQSTHEEKRSVLIAGIIANERNQLAEDELNEKPTRDLENLYALAATDESGKDNKPHYLLQGSGSKILASNKQEALVIPSYLEKAKG